MPRKVQVAVDEQGNILLPPNARHAMHLEPGMVLVVESDEQGALLLRVQRKQPILVEKDGVLVARVRAQGDLTQAVQRERERRINTLRSELGQ